MTAYMPTFCEVIDTTRRMIAREGGLVTRADLCQALRNARGWTTNFGASDDRASRAMTAALRMFRDWETSDEMDRGMYAADVGTLIERSRRREVAAYMSDYALTARSFACLADAAGRDVAQIAGLILSYCPDVDPDTGY